MSERWQTRDMRRPVQLALAVISLSTIAGCGKSDRLDVYTTEAIVLLDDQPFGPTRVMMTPLNPGGRSVAGDVDENGKVTFTSYDIGDGAPAGEYRVAVGLVMAPPPKPFPSIYRSPDRSPLKVTVEPKEKNELVIAMDSKAGALVKESSQDMMSRARQSPEWNAGAEPPPPTQ